MGQTNTERVISSLLDEEDSTELYKKLILSGVSVNDMLRLTREHGGTPYTFISKDFYVGIHVAVATLVDAGVLTPEVPEELLALARNSHLKLLASREAVASSEGRDISLLHFYTDGGSARE